MEIQPRDAPVPAADLPATRDDHLLEKVGALSRIDEHRAVQPRVCLVDVIVEPAAAQVLQRIRRFRLSGHHGSDRVQLGAVGLQVERIGAHVVDARIVVDERHARTLIDADLLRRDAFGGERQRRAVGGGN